MSIYLLAIAAIYGALTGDWMPATAFAWLLGAELAAAVIICARGQYWDLHELTNGPRPGQPALFSDKRGRPPV